MNMDAQDAQDNQDGTLLHEKPAPAMIVCGIVDTQEYKLAVSRKILCILCIHVNNLRKSRGWSPTGSTAGFALVGPEEAAEAWAVSACGRDARAPSYSSNSTTSPTPGCGTLPVLEFGSVGERAGDVVPTIVNRDERRINTKTDGPALLRRRHGRKATRERGRPARTTLAKPRPSPRPVSTGKDARALLGPGPCGSHRHGGRVRHRRETERQPKGEDAGGTPALPGGPLSSRLPLKGESAQTNWLDGRLKSRFDNPLVALRG